MVGPGGLDSGGLNGHDSAVVVLGQSNEAGLAVVGGSGVGGGAVAVRGEGGSGGHSGEEGNLGRKDSLVLMEIGKKALLQKYRSGFWKAQNNN